jgi:hypothetical protein
VAVWAKQDFLDTENLEFDERCRGTHGMESKDLLIVAEPDEAHDHTTATIYIRLPELHLFAEYIGFEEIGATSLPEEAVLIYGDQQEFSA